MRRNNQLSQLDNNVSINEALNYLGEPIYVEKHDIDEKQTTLLWYKFKSKLYPVYKRTVKSSFSLTDGAQIDSESFKQIKPESTGEYELWEISDKWLLVAIDDKSHQIIIFLALRGMLNYQITLN